MMRKNWFTIERLERDTYVISEYKHWEEPHCYLLLGQTSAILIDAGLGVADISQPVRAITSLPIQVVVTHVHSDHIGGCGYFQNIAVHRLEEPWLNGQFPLSRQMVLENNLLLKPCDFPPEFDPEQYQIYQGAPARVLEDGDWLDCGGRRLQALHTPGHSPGHICLWEPQRSALYSGDLAYLGKLDCFYPSTDPALFAQSLRRMAALPAKALRPGHHSLAVGADLLRRAAGAFDSLEKEGPLTHGRGIFDFGDFSIHM